MRWIWSMERKKGMSQGLLDRLFLDKSRIEAMAEGMCQVSELDDPIGEVLGMKKRPNGLLIGQKRVPLGVVGIIYEARPNVTADAFALCFKTGNVVILKGGSDAIHSNTAIVASLRKTLKEEQVPEDAPASDRRYLPRDDGAVYEDEPLCRCPGPTRRRRTDPALSWKTARFLSLRREPETVISTWMRQLDLSMAVDIILNAKTQRVGVCNACESIVVHENVREKLLPILEERLKENMWKCAQTKGKRIHAGSRRSDRRDWGKEYLDYIVSIKTVSSIDEAIAHINHYNTKHSEAIITNNYTHAQKFLDEIDAAVVYVNASHPLHRRLRIRLRCRKSE